MVLAAGFGKRMHPLTLERPKPLIKVAGKTLLDHALDALERSGIEHAIVNTHYLAQQISDHVKTRQVPRVSISHEEDHILDSGGGVKQALSLLGEIPFLVLNADTFWQDADHSNLDAFRAFWDPSIMDVLLLLSPMKRAVGFDGSGDFYRSPDGRLRRRGGADAAPFAYAGAAIFKPDLFHGIAESVFSLNRIFDDCIASGTLFGLPLDGLWLHVGTPDAIDLAEDALKNIGLPG
ncbi:MAG: nucleotidyltransferase family protein [Pseudomonadota bacterium]